MKNVSVEIAAEDRKEERSVALSVVAPAVITVFFFLVNQLDSWENLPLITGSVLAACGLRLFWRILFMGFNWGDAVARSCIEGLIGTGVLGLVIAGVLYSFAPELEWLMWLTPWILVLPVYQWKKRNYQVLLSPQLQRGRISFYKLRDISHPFALLRSGTCVERGRLVKVDYMPIDFQVLLERHGNNIHQESLRLQVSIDLGRLKNNQEMLNEGIFRHELDSLLVQTLLKVDPEGVEDTFAYTLPRALYAQGMTADDALGRFKAELPRELVSGDVSIPLTWGCAYEA